jgi:DNA-binding NarL/FixJ family response regulator
VTPRTDAGPVDVIPPVEPETITVAIRDPHPLYRLGLATVLREAGFGTAEPDDVDAWARARPRPAVVATMEDARDLELARSLRRTRDDTVLVCLLCEHPAAAYQLALSSGADAAVHRDAPLAEILSVFQAALGDRTLLPTGVARTLAEDGGVGCAAPELCDEERALLQTLAAGDTVSQIAEAMGFSDREMYRRLRRLYRRLGCKNRSEALVLAARARLV